MNETTFISIEKASELMKSDPDHLLIAGIEGRIQLYGLLGNYVTLTSGIKLVAPEDPESPDSYKEELKDEWIDFFPIDRATCAAILRDGISAPIYWISQENDEDQWQIYGSEYADTPDFVIKKSAIFLKRDSVESIASGRTPSAGEVSDVAIKGRRKCHMTREKNNLLCVIAAMMDQLHVDPEKRGVPTKISEWTQSIGAPVGDQTIKGIIEEAKVVADERSKNS